MYRLAAVIILVGISLKSKAENLDSLFQLLEQTMSERSAYDDAKLNRISAIRELLNDKTLSPEERYIINNRLILEFTTYSFDSTIKYINRNYRLIDENENIKDYKVKLLSANLMARSGSYKESLDIMFSIPLQVLDSVDLLEYYRGMSIIYDNLRYYGETIRMRPLYQSNYENYLDSLNSLLDPNDDLALETRENMYREQGLLDKCFEINDRRLKRFQSGLRAYSMVCYQRAMLYEMLGDEEQQLKYFILSAISDIQGSVKDNASMSHIALILFEDGHIDRAYKFINFSFDDTERFNSRLRLSHLSDIFPSITGTYRQKIDEQNNKLKYLFIVVSILTVGLAIALFSVARQIRKVHQARNELHNVNQSLREVNIHLTETNDKLHTTNKTLLETDNIKEQYIANFLNICSDFIDKLENYRHMVKRMIVNEKIQELLERVSAQEFIDQEVKQFYETFDTTFLNIYPDFVDRINEMLVENERIELKKGELLNTELRIFALIRLGITDSQQISKLLRYSVNTIYNYRVKVKNKAMGPRENFEDEIMKINALSNDAN